MSSGAVSVIPVPNLPEVQAGAELPQLILDALGSSRLTLERGDVVVVTHKVVSKAEGRIVRLSSVQPSDLACRFAADSGKDPRHVEVVLRESVRIVRMERGIIISETRHGFVCANAGVDASNVPGDDVVCLLPNDPDGVARRLRTAWQSALGIELAVVITDSFGRPWRNGIVNVAIGASGLEPLRDYRGGLDPYGRELSATVIAVADELAAAAELVMGKTDGVPVAIVRGYRYSPSDSGAAELVMPRERDLFR
ncbi:MAG: coenzyme F420-0:L-glutamate ligase [Chloroflexota bacterium]|nr:coenzyme F420-0:L-glutamate ligase [Chloroflexota bacterium]